MFLLRKGLGTVGALPPRINLIRCVSDVADDKPFYPDPRDNPDPRNDPRLTRITTEKLRLRVKGKGLKTPRIAVKMNVYDTRVDPKLYDLEYDSIPVSASAAFGDIAEDREKSREFFSDFRSLTARGFLRFQKGYEPPLNIAEKFLELVRTIDPKLSTESDSAVMKINLNDPNFKYEVLSKAAEKFDHAVPNSLLYTITTIGDASVFYSTPIHTVTPYDSLLKMDNLPPNLHLQKNYIRFTEETSHFFKGITAFPRESNIITGLRAKQKYKGYTPQKVWTVPRTEEY